MWSILRKFPGIACISGGILKKIENNTIKLNFGKAKLNLRKEEIEFKAYFRL